MAGSNGYQRTAPPAVNGFTGAFLDNAIISNPTDCNGNNTLVGAELFTTSYFDPNLCATKCQATNDQSTKNPPANGASPLLCKSFNTYILAQNGNTRGQYCALYSQTWAPGMQNYATETVAQPYPGGDVYTFGESYTYTNTSSPGLPICPSDIAYLKTAGADFCTSYNQYTPPVVSTQTTTTVLHSATATATQTSTAATTTLTTAVATSVTTAVATSVSTAVATSSTTAVATISTATTTTTTQTTYPYNQAKLAALHDNGIQARPLAAVHATPVATPSSIAGWEAASISAACSQVATGTQTSTGTLYSDTTATTSTTATTITSTTQTQTTTSTTLTTATSTTLTTTTSTTLTTTTSTTRTTTTSTSTTLTSVTPTPTFKIQVFKDSNAQGGGNNGDVVTGQWLQSFQAATDGGRRIHFTDQMSAADVWSLDPATNNGGFQVLIPATDWGNLTWYRPKQIYNGGGSNGGPNGGPSLVYINDHTIYGQQQGQALTCQLKGGIQQQGQTGQVLCVQPNGPIQFLAMAVWNENQFGISQVNANPNGQDGPVSEYLVLQYTIV
ncbi:carbohydrate-binding-like protein [Apiospora marii]